MRVTTESKCKGTASVKCQQRWAQWLLTSRPAQLEVPDAQPSQAVRILKQLVQDPLLCAIVAAVLYSLVASVVVPHLTGPERLPWIVSQLVDFFTRPFSVTALLLTGANLATALETKSTQAAGSFYFVAIPVCLVVAKNFLCPYATRLEQPLKRLKNA